ncbi:hypothetical protein ACUNWD_17965 [Sunxiuqinia sp. A32]|uniref:hypothetical protein n=1 Tax=Sunxiuqinia sp. A32 TaxID=3461496 RepID=UPI004045B9AB
MTDIEFSYCKVCKNRGIKYPLGVICKISQDKPQFKQDCMHYEFDNEEYQTLKNNCRKYYSGLNEKGNSLGRRVNINTITYEQTHISDRSQSKLGSRLPLSMEFKRSATHYLFSHIIPSLFFIIGIPYYFKNKMNDDIIKILVIVSVIFFIGIMIWAAKQVIFNKPKIILDNKGIRIDGKDLIIWRDVLMTQIKTKHEQFTHEYLCISQISTTQNIEVNIQNLNVMGWQLGHYIETYKMKYQKL